MDSIKQISKTTPTREQVQNFEDFLSKLHLGLDLSQHPFQVNPPTEAQYKVLERQFYED